ncbi:hypothetical protein AALA17_02800 [Lactobacillaceae bacterium 24-114]
MKKDIYSFWNQKIINEQVLYEISFSIFLFASILQYSTFMSFFSHNLFHYFMYIGLGILYFKIFFIDKPSAKEFFLKVAVLGLLVLIWRKSSDFTLFTMGTYILGAKYVDFRRIIKLYFVLGTTILIFVMISSLTGLIKNLVYYRDVSGTIRQSFGIIYPTDFAAHVLYLVLAYSYLRFSKLNFVDYIAYVIIASLLIIYCDARLSALTIILAIPILWIGQQASRGNDFNRKVAYFYWWVPVFGAYATLCSYFFYNPHNTLFLKLNAALSGRLAIGSTAINKYGFTWFGTHIVEHGWGGEKGYAMSHNNPMNYFYVDSSFLRIGIMYGVVALIAILVIMSIISWRSIQDHTYALASILVLVTVSAIVEQRLIDLSFDPFLIAILANVKKNKFNNLMEERS